MAVGLFTLDSATLGRLDSSPLGGFGTGFVAASSSSTGSVAGVLGLPGSVSGSSASSGTASGAAGRFGSVAASSVSAGTVVGVEGDQGAVSGASTSSGTAAGVPGYAGSVDGSVGSSGAAVGSPAVAGTAEGTSVSSGTASGTGGVTPVPPTPAPALGGGARFQLPIFPPPPRWVGRTQPGRSRARGAVTGRCGYAGHTATTHTAHGAATGARWPSDELVATWARQASEETLLMLEVL